MARLAELIIDYVFFGPWSWLFRILDFFIPKDSSLMIFGSNSGNNFSDNSKSLFEFVIENSNKIKPIWITRNKGVFDDIEKKYPGKVVFSPTIKSAWTYLRSKQIIISHSYLDMSLMPYTKNKTVNYLWHGTPIKKIGNFSKKSTEIGSRKSPHWRRWNNNIDHFFAGSEYEAKIMKEAFNKEFSIHITGNPRNDKLYNSKKSENKKITTILYAPTWRFGEGLKQNNSTPILHPDLSENKVNQFLIENNLKLIIRPHPLAGKMHYESNLIECVTINEEAEIFRLFEKSDILITDYSSAYFDWLILKKPVIFSCYDINEYEEEFGFIDDLKRIFAGPICMNPEDLFSEIKRTIGDEYIVSEKLEDIYSEVIGEYDGQARERIMRILENRVKED